MEWNKSIWLIQGAFDIIHAWHARTLQYCKRYCDYLIVALNTPEFIPQYKNSIPIQTQKQKQELLEAIKYVDKVVPADNFSPQELLEKYNVDTYIVGSERVEHHPNEIKYIEDKGGKVIVSPRWKWIKSTSQIKADIINQSK
jgi:cytidyltransferase-like protein